MSARQAFAIYKSILRNSPAFTGYGHPTAWDLPTLRATYPQTAATLRGLIEILAS